MIEDFYCGSLLMSDFYLNMTFNAFSHHWCLNCTGLRQTHWKSLSVLVFPTRGCCKQAGWEGETIVKEWQVCPCESVTRN